MVQCNIRRWRGTMSRQNVNMIIMAIGSQAQPSSGLSQDWEYKRHRAFCAPVLGGVARGLD
jgi:hypothetical protein